MNIQNPSKTRKFGLNERQSLSDKQWQGNEIYRLQYEIYTITDQLSVQQVTTKYRYEWLGVSSTMDNLWLCGFFENKLFKHTSHTLSSLKLYIFVIFSEGNEHLYYKIIVSDKNIIVNTDSFILIKQIS